MKSRLKQKSFSKLAWTIILVTCGTAIAISTLFGWAKEMNTSSLNNLKSTFQLEKPVQAKEEIKELTQKQMILNYIVEVFGDDADDAIKIADCESGLNPNQIGDQHLMSFDEKWQEMKGDSIGIFQIRTGGEDFNRARANGMSTDEFRDKLKDFKYNIDYAKTIYDRAGNWSPWFNCMNKVGL